MWLGLTFSSSLRVLLCVVGGCGVGFLNEETLHHYLFKARVA